MTRASGELCGDDVVLRKVRKIDYAAMPDYSVQAHYQDRMLRFMAGLFCRAASASARSELRLVWPRPGLASI